MTPTYPRILPDRDQVNDFYLDEDVIITLHNGHTIHCGKGFRFDAHSVPWWARLVFPRYIPTENNIGNDIHCALAHDVLVATEHWHRYPRWLVDYEYWRFMQMPEYKMTEARAKWMPWAVQTWGKIKYWRRAYRGDYSKYQTHITIKVDMV